MPIYEYACVKCGRTSSFLVRNTAAHETPACPHCKSKRMKRALSRFSAVATRKSGGRSAAPADDTAAGSGTEGPPMPGGGAEGPMPDMAEMESMMSGMDENDPRSMGRMMRKLSEQTGEPLDGEMEEVVRRLESGEDPEKIEEQMGDVMGEGDGGGGGSGDELYDG
ncbi:MAG: zinc ribbon domain-containing protein [Kiritimatiellae bacterium]|nr:zinc ribbon domain-containing protein [Kiritimatiellia bacterium]